MSGSGGDVLAFTFDFTNGKGCVAYNNSYGLCDPVLGLLSAFTWATGSPWFFAWSRFSESVNGSPVTIRPNAATQSFAPPTGYTSWD